MNSRIKKGIAAAAAAVAAAAVLVVGNAANSTAAPPRLQAFGITGDGLTMAAFRTDTPQVLDWVQDIVGLPNGNVGVGIDFRVQNNTLYLLDNHGFIYTIAIPSDGSQPVRATRVSQLTVPLDGTNFGFDFNPAADRLRIVSDNGQNLRHNLNDHTTVADTPLTVNGAPAKGVTGAAYTNNDLNGATGTTLTDVSAVLDQVLIQSPPNEGKLVATGSLGFDAGPSVGYDIFADLVSGKTVSNQGFAALNVGGVAAFYTVNVLTGEAGLVGNFPRVAPIADIAVALDTM